MIIDSALNWSEKKDHATFLSLWYRIVIFSDWDLYVVMLIVPCLALLRLKNCIKVLYIVLDIRWVLFEVSSGKSHIDAVGHTEYRLRR